MAVEVGSIRFFMDRGLGSKIVPDRLRARGWQIVTMDERYGREASKGLDDPDWLADAAREGEACLCKDAKIAQRPAEAQTVYMWESRVFALGNAQLTGEVGAEWFARHEIAIHRMAAKIGPYVAGVFEQRMRRLRLNYP